MNTPKISLLRRAVRLWPRHLPHSDRNRREWLRAVATVRSTSTGWHLDRQAAKAAR